MKMTFRWYGKNDSISLEYIKQIPNVKSVVTAIYDIPVGEVWPLDKIIDLKEECKKAGLSMEVIESVPVHEDIKMGVVTRDKYIEAYKKTILNLGKAGVKCICYNFMPVFDWVRTNLYTQNTDKSYSLSYSEEEIIRMDPKNLHLPGWDESYSQKELSSLLDRYKDISKDDLFDNLVYFLNSIMPACNEAGINMAIHPDDPPWDIFNLPRIVNSEKSIEKMFNAVPDRHNGLTFCTGSLGANKENNLIEMAEKFSDRIYFAHLRQINIIKDREFIESGHMTDSGSLDIYGIVRSLVKSGFDGYVRPDHGRNIWGENGKPGYGLYDRALGACYLNGLFEALEKEKEVM